MAYPLNKTQLCTACRSLTFVMLQDGYTHPLSYKDTVASGRTCRLCRLMICSVGKLQTISNCYQLESAYNAMSGALLRLPAVSRHATHGLPPIIERMNMPRILQWRGDPMPEHQVRGGNYNGGETIQIMAPEGSDFRTRGWVPLRSTEPASSTRNYDALRQWLDTCRSSHAACRPSCLKEDGSLAARESSTPLPSRVVNVGLAHEPDKCPRLLLTNGASGEYVCLSHRWGTHRKEAQTERSRLEEFQRSLPMDQMPPSFRDAMEVTRQLGFRYLWIDSLCIVQDDKDDWIRESRRMGDIYENASCTIAAVDALDRDGVDRGLFLPRDLDPLEVTLALPYNKVPLKELSRRVFKKAEPICVWKYRWLAPPRTENSVSSLGRNTISLRPRVVSLYQRVSRSEWFRRGWVLQERLLSRRIIYYTSDKLYWGCLTTTSEEQGADPTFPVTSPLCSTDGDVVYCASKRWKEIVRDYVRCGLTYKKDRLVALSGVFAKLETPAAQIHAGTLHDPTRPGDGLLWYTSPSPLRAFSDFHAPSWSWACLNGIVSFDLPEPLGDGTSLLRDLKFETRDGHAIGHAEAALCEGTCVSGTVSLEGPAGTLSRGGRVVDQPVQEHPVWAAMNRAVLSSILGSALCRGSHIPRFDEDGNEIEAGSELLPVPQHTEMLVEECGCILGFFIPDHPVDQGERGRNRPIWCVGVKVWGPPPEGQPALSRGMYAASSGECRQEQTVDIIGLEEVAGEPGKFRRLGRGRVICTTWLARCKNKRVSVI